MLWEFPSVLVVTIFLNHEFFKILLNAFSAFNNLINAVREAQCLQVTDSSIVMIVLFFLILLT